VDQAAIVGELVVEHLFPGPVYLFERDIKILRDGRPRPPLDESCARFLRVARNVDKVLPTGGIDLRIEYLIETGEGRIGWRTIGIDSGSEPDMQRIQRGKRRAQIRRIERCQVGCLLFGERGGGAGAAA
jgi:hypothetical protein